MLFRRVVTATLTGLLVAVIAALIVALHATSVARREAKESLARQLAATATALQATNLRASLVLAAQGVKTLDGVPERAALLTSDLASPKLRTVELSATITPELLPKDKTPTDKNDPVGGFVYSGGGIGTSTRDRIRLSHRRALAAQDR